MNLELSTIHFPVTALASITHRVTGVFLVAAVAVLLYLLDLSLRSEAGFEQARQLLGSEWAKLVLWAVLAGLIYHTVAGIRHLIMDLGVGETLEGGRRGATIVFVVAAILVLLAGAWLW